MNKTVPKQITPEAPVDHSRNGGARTMVLRPGIDQGGRRSHFRSTGRARNVTLSVPISTEQLMTAIEEEGSRGNVEQ